VQGAKDNFREKVEGSSPENEDWLVIAHDIHEQTAKNLTGYMLEMMNDGGWRGVTVGNCLGDPSENWYRSGGVEGEDVFFFLIRFPVVGRWSIWDNGISKRRYPGRGQPVTRLSTKKARENEDNGY
jgi:hypothetical protein